MELEQLDILEKRISNAVKLIEQLKEENHNLTAKVGELQAESHSNGLITQQLKEENDNLRLLHNESSFGKEKEEQIRSKVEQMLCKLDELEGL